VIRLQKVLADRGVASRRKAEELIVAGRVRVDGETVSTLGTRVAPDARIEVDGTPTRQAAHRYVLLNKPMGIVSTANDERGRRTVVDLIGARDRLYPVGRLDTDSEGMLLLTNDGDWAERVLHPRYGHEREYDVSVAGELTPAAVAQLRTGVRLEEGIARALRLEIVSRSRTASRVRIVLQTGWRRQVRRMLAAVGLKVTRLVRVRIGAMALGKLRTGEWRDLEAREIAELARPATPQPRRAQARSR
jgi:23S rRNA pseudouridine2605 synthase